MKTLGPGMAGLLVRGEIPDPSSVCLADQNAECQLLLGRHGLRRDHARRDLHGGGDSGWPRCGRRRGARLLWGIQTAKLL